MKRIELLVPVFFGCLGSLVLSAALSTQWLGLWSGDKISEAEVQDSEQKLEDEHSPVVENVHFFAKTGSEQRNFIRDMYRNPDSRGRVIAFFTEVCASQEIAEAILTYSDSYDIPPALAVALAWEESRLNPRAVNSKNRDESIDRGLFQLNNRSFPRLDTPSFFNLEVNAKNAMSHLRYCLDTGGSEVAALAMYNAGAGRVRSAGTPKTTLDYIGRILENRWKIEDRFAELEHLLLENPGVSQEQLEIAGTEPDRPLLVPLMPLAGN